MKAYALLWNHATNAMRVATVDWLLKRNCNAYTGNRPQGWVPLYIGDKETVRTAMENCQGTLASRGPCTSAAEDLRVDERNRAAEASEASA